MADYEGVSRRFQEGFSAFEWERRMTAAAKVLATEITHETLVRNPDFIAQVAGRIDEEALLEKRYVFISVNPVLAE